MRSAYEPYHYSADAFEQWSLEREASLPYFAEVWQYVGRQLAGAEAILDIAGGEGHTLSRLDPDLHPAVTVMDINQPALERLHQRHPETKAVKADARKMPFESESFDAAIAVNAVEVFKQPNALNEIERVLRPGGRLIFFRDLAQGLESLAKTCWESLDLKDRERVFVLPLINRDNEAVDKFALLPHFAIDLFEDEATPYQKLVLEDLEPYLGDDWQLRIYERDDGQHMPDLAKRFTRLTRMLATVLADHPVLQGREPFSVTESLEEAVDDVQFYLFEDSGLELSREYVEVDCVIEPPLSLMGRLATEFFVDGLSNGFVKHPKGSERPTSTRVRGHTPVYMATKPVTF